MTPEQRIKREILVRAEERQKKWGESVTLPDLTDENIDAVYDELRDEWCDTVSDEEMDFRGDGVVTDITPKPSWYFAAESHAIKLQDGGWVGWTFYYGGGKHDEPDAVDWMPDAYEVEMTEETKVVQVFRRMT
jgi:hypothetical protein